MEASILSEIIKGFGPAGAFVAYLIWSQMRRDTLDKDRLDADKELASALARLTSAIEGWKH